MTSHSNVSLRVCALLLSGSLVSCAGHSDRVATISDGAQGRAVSLAAEAGAKAKKAIERHRDDDAIAAAEAAVGWQPQDAGYRALLGQSYLAAGRFLSARDAYADALSLSPGDGRVALNLALAQTAVGDAEGARRTLGAHADSIPAADRGLAFALAGDPISAVQILGEAARSPAATAKVRQNLALSLALGGRWQEARAAAALDLGSDEIDRRIEEWARFAQASSPAHQVAALLGVPVAADQGQPVALALAATVPNKASGETPALTADAASLAEAPALTSPTLATAADPAGTAAIPSAAAPSTGAQSADERLLAAMRDDGAKAPPAAPKPVPATARRRVAAAKAAPGKAAMRGDFYVQLGAYATQAVAHDGWVQAVRRFAPLGGHTPQGSPVTTNGMRYYRLSVGGFARADADAICRRYRLSGGVCFVRAGAGDKVAAWVNDASQVALR